MIFGWWFLLRCAGGAEFGKQLNFYMSLGPSHVKPHMGLHVVPPRETKNNTLCMIFHEKTMKKTFLWHPLDGPLLYDERQNETRPRPPKKRKLIQYLLHGVPETGLPRPGVLGVGWVTFARSIVGTRRCVGENDGTKVEKITKIIHFDSNFDQNF